uniref:ATP synthase complex subunit 8 n=1 Tax=Svistella anhuiensis TaxID=2152901 RepID=A0A856T8Z6_9ORTH|nr:ATP synthase F0 subunit 8 [Svistella anhuiensis]QFG38960.1 ATP synthase F0 subunit 8 [Svistella anhuiensis]
MPQMSPMNWVMLFMIFITIFVFQMILNYFILQPTKKQTPLHLNNQKSLNWKW